MNIFIESHKVIEENISKLSDAQMCNYYYRKRKIFEELADTNSFSHGTNAESRKI